MLKALLCPQKKEKRPSVLFFKRIQYCLVAVSHLNATSLK